MPDHVHTGSDTSGECPPHDGGALHARPEEYELRLAAQPPRRERGGKLFGVREVVERTDGDDGRKAREAYRRAGDHGVEWRDPFDNGSIGMAFLGTGAVGHRPPSFGL